MIHSDFITSASRESAIDCPWNNRLVEGIADAFANAIEQFCTTGRFLHDWTHFVPQEPMVDIWKLLRVKIIVRLQGRRVAQSWETRSLKPASQLRQLPKDFQHNGFPLFADLCGGDRECYLAPEYDLKGPELLRLLGSHDMNYPMFLDRLEADLKQQDSRLRHKPLEDPWHHKLAGMLLKILKYGSKKSKERLRTAKMIPLVQGTWRASPDQLDSTKIYLPKYEDVYVPFDLGVDIVRPIAASFDVRKQLYLALGVEEWPPGDVVHQIQLRHDGDHFCSKEALVQHLRYLYWVWPTVTINDHSKLWVQTGGLSRHRVAQGIYFRSDVHLSSFQLLHNTFGDDQLLVSSRLQTGSFIDDSYFQVTHTDRPDSNLTWRKWLEEIVGIRTYPLLMDPDSRADLSLIIMQVLAKDSSRVLRLLKARWSVEYQDLFASSEETQVALRSAKVLCKDGTYRELESTYLPTSAILAREIALDMVGKLPILDLGHGDVGVAVSEWEFLRTCGVEMDLDLQFHVIALRYLASEEHDDVTRVDGIAQEIYRWIGDNAKHAEAEYLR